MALEAAEVSRGQQVRCWVAAVNAIAVSYRGQRPIRVLRARIGAPLSFVAEADSLLLIYASSLSVALRTDAEDRRWICGHHDEGPGLFRVDHHRGVRVLRNQYLGA